MADKPPIDAKFTIRLGNLSAETKGESWSDWLTFDRAHAASAVKEYPNLYLKSLPLVMHLQFSPASDPMKIQVEAKIDENKQTVKMEAELFGPTLGILAWRDADNQPRLVTMAEYNRRYWAVLKGFEIPENRRPKRFPVVDRFIGGDDDYADWREGIENLSRAGFSAIQLEPKAAIRKILMQTPVKRTAWAVYSPPGYVFAEGDPNSKTAPQPLDEWARHEAKAFFDAGYQAKDVAFFAMADEPGWYYPASFALAHKPAVLERFHDYLRMQNLKPADVGAADWATVKPIGRSQAKDLPSKRLFYWSTRFFSWDAARYSADATRAMESAFYPGIPLSTNWNFFSGRLYVPGPVANNPDKKNPDAAMGGHDWFEFGKMRGCNMLWTEDWFADSQAYQWSFYASKLRCAGAKSQIPFGGYVVPRASGDMKDGLVQKMLCLVGSGAQCVNTYVFGPEYNFPGNCYSDNPQLLRQLAEANAMIGQAEDFLIDAKRPAAHVAILMPRSAELWDAKDQATPSAIQDATSNHLNNDTVDYMAEVFDAYTMFQHANVPVDFVDEDDLTAKGLKPYDFLYVTEPNVPAEGQSGIVDWVSAGGRLITVTGAAARDRYDEPCDVLSNFTGYAETARPPMLITNLHSLKPWEKVNNVPVVGPRGKLLSDKVEKRASFGDGSPAVVHEPALHGAVDHFLFMPGLSYVHGSTPLAGNYPSHFPAEFRELLLESLIPDVPREGRTDHDLVETPVLLSERGAAVTLLNWNAGPIEKLKVTLALPFDVKEVTSVRRGKIPFAVEGKHVVLSVGLESNDILLVSKTRR
ncbi:MAG TPA: hypothetical protein VFE47_12855 [Tepidisphaeraceae bacterium]|nr:hypothetical protein [Tepidisphaeraceae bacterium]